MLLLNHIVAMKVASFEANRRNRNNMIKLNELYQITWIDMNLCYGDLVQF